MAARREPIDRRELELRRQLPRGQHVEFPNRPRIPIIDVLDQLHDVRVVGDRSGPSLLGVDGTSDRACVTCCDEPGFDKCNRNVLTGGGNDQEPLSLVILDAAAMFADEALNAIFVETTAGEHQGWYWGCSCGRSPGSGKDLVDIALDVDSGFCF